MACGPINPLGCAGDLVDDSIGGIANSAFHSVAQSFVSAANMLLKAFAKAFVAIPPLDLTSPGVRSVYGISLGLAGVVAAFLLFGQVIRTSITHDGSALAHGLVGVGRAALAFMLTLIIAGTALKAADELTNYIVVSSFGSTKALSEKVGGLIQWDIANGMADASALLLLLAVVGILLTLVLWFELLLRNAAIAVLVATSPIAAAGQVSESTKSWWTKTAAATGQLIILKPVIALVFALGFGMTGKSKDIQSLLAGMLVLILAVFAWPAIARFFAFASVAVGGSAGLGAVLGFAAGKAGAGGGAPTGVDPDQFSQAAEARTMASSGQSGGSAAAAGGAVAAGAGIAGVAVQAAQKAINHLSGGMDQMASHAGMGGRSAAHAAGAPGSSGGGQRGGYPAWADGGGEGSFEDTDPAVPAPPPNDPVEREPAADPPPTPHPVDESNEPQDGEQ